jgi:hypothetical protein
MPAIRRLCLGGASGALLIMLIPGSASAQAPVLSSVNPTQGPVGTQVTLTGSGFTATGNRVHFGIGGSKDVAAENGTTIRYTIPGGISPCDFIEPSAPRCLAPVMRVDVGSYEISVSNANGRTSVLTFMVR